MQAYEGLEDLQICFEVAQQLGHEAIGILPEVADEMNLQERMKISALLHDAYVGASEKLAKYMDPNCSGQPALLFLKACRIFNPARVATLSHEQQNFTAIPGFDCIPPEEFHKYVETLAPACCNCSSRSC